MTGLRTALAALAGPELAEAAIARAPEEKPQITTSQEKLLKAGFPLPPAPGCKREPATAGRAGNE